MSSEKHTQLYRYVLLCRLIYETWKIILPPLIFVVINKQTTTNFEYYNVIGRQIVKKLKDLYSLYHRKKSPGLNCWKTAGTKCWMEYVCIRCSFNGFASTYTRVLHAYLLICDATTTIYSRSYLVRTISFYTKY